MQNVQLNLSDEVYEQVKRRAAQAGFASIDAYVADVLSGDEPGVDEALDHLFTTERLAHIDKAIATVNAGGPTHTMDEVRENLASNRADWIRKKRL